MKPGIIVHGGASSVPDDEVQEKFDGVQAAAMAGYKVLMDGGSALDAVEASVIFFENSPIFNAGTGSHLTADGTVEMDAVIMEGKDLRTGAVASVNNVKHPIQLARAVMEKTSHCMLVGDGARNFAKECGMELVSQESLITKRCQEQLAGLLHYDHTVKSHFSKGRHIEHDEEHDTVGACAIDKDGNVAFATSTGGITAKRPGRVGDSPLVGSGGYCDNRVGAFSTTGHGESIMKVCLARHCSGLVEQGMPVQQAIDTSLKYLRKRVNGHAGVIGVDKNGNFGTAFNTERMPYCIATNGELQYGVDHNECNKKKI